jgi:tetratricopeptide (TPR) repeat protein
MSESQWTLNVEISELDGAAMDAKSKWKLGDKITVQIEKHATVNMMKQRIALIVRAHSKHQEILGLDGAKLDDIQKLEDIPGLVDGGKLKVAITLPPEPEIPPVEISDDEGLFSGEEPALPDTPAEADLTKELTDAEMDKQGELKQQSADAMEDGDVDTAVAKFTEALMIGGVSAMMVSKRAEMLFKQKRYKAAIADATLALKLNPDSAKAYRIRAKANRLLGEYEASASDFSQAQGIDYDDGVKDMHDYVKRRWEKIQLKAKQDAKAAAKAEAEAAKAKA